VASERGCKTRLVGRPSCFLRFSEGGGEAVTRAMCVNYVVGKAGALMQCGAC